MPNRERLSTGGSTANRERLNTGGSNATTVSNYTRDRLNTGGSSIGIRERAHTLESEGGIDDNNNNNNNSSTIPFPVLVWNGSSGHPSSPPPTMSGSGTGKQYSSPAHYHLQRQLQHNLQSQRQLVPGYSRRRTAVDWIQRHKVPRSWIPFYCKLKPQPHPRRPLALSDADVVYLVDGLDRVFLGDSGASCADEVTILGLKPPRYLWYMLSGALCDIIQFGFDVFLHYMLTLQDASLCWATGFVLSIVFRHTSHRYLVFGDFVGGYWNSLGRMYAGYSVIIVLSTLFNALMTKAAAISHYVAWVLTLLWTGIANYFILKRIWNFGGKSSKNALNVRSPTSPPQSYPNPSSPCMI